jgi:glycosidase
VEISEDKSHTSKHPRAASGGSHPAWLNQAVFYQICPQSYYDSNGDGIGDILGILQKLDYLQWLGINVLWINPCFVSPFRDAGYDVADYYRVAPRYGTNRDLYRLCREAHRRGIRICLDLVAGHTSTDHPWFKASCRSRRNNYSDRYIWAPPAISSEEDVRLSFIRGYAEKEDSYISNFFYFQPALNYGFARPAQTWQQPVDAPGPLDTRKELVKIMTYWLAHGADGFRVDMASSLVKTDPDHTETIKLWQDIGRDVRSMYPDTVLIAEWGNPAESIAAGFNIDFMFHIGVPGYADLMLNEKCFFRRHDGISIMRFLTPFLEQSAHANGKGLISVPSGNHDIKRPHSDRRTTGDLKVLFTFLLTWPGVPFVYYGDEIGMRYISGMTSKEGGYGRTGSRTPMQWSDALNAGFSTADEKQLYLPLDPRRNRPTVERQSHDTGSLLNHVRNLIALRKRSPALQAEGDLIPLPVESSDCHFAYLRQFGSERFLIVLNPAAKSGVIRINGIKPYCMSPEINSGTRVYISRDDVEIKLGKVSYGVFRL